MTDEGEGEVLVEGDDTCRHCLHPNHMKASCDCGCDNYEPIAWKVMTAGPLTTYEDELFTCPDCRKTFTVSGFSFQSYDEHRSLVLDLHRHEDCRALKNLWKYGRWRVKNWWRDRKSSEHE